MSFGFKYLAGIIWVMYLRPKSGRNLVTKTGGILMDSILLGIHCLNQCGQVSGKECV